MRLISERAATLAFAALALAGCGGNQSESSHWSGKTFLLEFPAKHWNQPSNKTVAQAVGDFVPQFLLSLSASGSTETALVATATDGVQNPCNRTQQLTVTESQYPDSQFVITDFSIRLKRTDSGTGKTASVRATIRNLTFKNLLPGADGTPRTDGSFSASGYMGDLAPLFFLQDNPTAESICSLLGSNQYETPCETCTFNSEQHCLTVGAVQIGAKVTTASITPVSENDSAAACL